MKALLAIAAFALPATAQTTTRVSVDSTGVEFEDYIYVGGWPSLSTEGRHIGFLLKTGPDCCCTSKHCCGGLPEGTSTLNGYLVHDRQTGITELVAGTAFCEFGGEIPLSGDGRYACFSSSGGSSSQQIFLADRITGQSAMISIDSSGFPGDGGSTTPRVSADARRVVYETDATNLFPGDLNGTRDVVIADVQTGSTTPVSISTSGSQANAPSWRPAISADGRYVSFSSLASNLVVGDSNASWDVFLRDLALGTTILASVNSLGSAAGSSGLESSLSSDGRFVVFTSDASDLVTGDTNGMPDVFVRDLLEGATSRISLDSAGQEANAPSHVGPWSVSGDGQVVVFTSDASNLVSNDTNAASDVFRRDRGTGITERISLTAGGAETVLGGSLGSLAANGSRIAFVSFASDLVVGDTNFLPDVFVRDLDANCSPIADYCTAKLNSQGCAPVIGASGMPRLTGPDAFFLTAVDVLSGKNGLIFWGLAPAALPFGGGTLCVQPPLVRTGVQNSGGNPPPTDCSGAYSCHFSQSYMAAHGMAAGLPFYAQYWSRDPGFTPPDNVGLTAGVQFTVCP